MSVSSNSRKESTESNAAQQMHSTMGIHPELAQLNDKNLENDLPSRVADTNVAGVPGDLEDIKDTVSETSDSGMSDRDIEEAKRASWGQAPLPANAEDASTDEDNPMTAYQQPTNNMPPALTDTPADTTVTVSHSTSEGVIPATRTNEPDRTLGNS